MCNHHILSCLQLLRLTGRELCSEEKPGTTNRYYSSETIRFCMLNAISSWQTHSANKTCKSKGRRLPYSYTGESVFSECCFSADEAFAGLHGLPDAHSSPRSGALISHSKTSHISCASMPTGQQQHFNGSNTIQTTMPIKEIMASKGKAIMTSNHRQHAVSELPSVCASVVSAVWPG